MHKNNTSTPEVRPATITAEAMVRAEEFARALVEDDDGVGLFDAQDLAAGHILDVHAGLSGIASRVRAEVFQTHAHAAVVTDAGQHRAEFLLQDRRTPQ